MAEKLIHVTFIEAATGEPFAEVDLPVERLPEHFALQTTIHLGDQDWEVVNAEPMSAKEFIAIGVLKLTLTPLINMPVDNILYSLPTISDELPNMTPRIDMVEMHLLTLHDDDWRQIELIDQSFKAEISTEMASIRRIFAEERVEMTDYNAFKKMHIRSLIAEPIKKQCLYQDLFEQLNEHGLPYDGCSFAKMDGIIRGGFAHQLSGVEIYGFHHQGQIKVLGLQLTSEANHQLINDSAKLICQLMNDHNLYLVDWCRGICLSADQQAITDYLTT